METEGKTQLKIQCPNHCARLVTDHPNHLRHQRQTLEFTIANFWGEVVYSCPQCGMKLMGILDAVSGLFLANIIQSSEDSN